MENLRIEIYNHHNYWHTILKVLHIVYNRYLTTMPSTSGNKRILYKTQCERFEVPFFDVDQFHCNQPREIILLLIVFSIYSRCFI